MMDLMGLVCQPAVLESLNILRYHSPGVNSVRTDIGSWET